MAESDFASRAYRGEIIIGIDPAFARRFFTDSSNADIEVRIGEPVYIERAVVMGSFVLEPLMLIVSIVAAVSTFGWWSLIVGPASVLAWFGYRSRSSAGRQHILGALLIVAMAVAAPQFIIMPRAVSLWLFAYAAALFLARWVYFSATKFLRAIVIRNEHAREMLQASLVIREVGPRSPDA